MSTVGQQVLGGHPLGALSSADTVAKVGGTSHSNEEREAANT